MNVESFPTGLLIMAALGFWGAILVQRGIAVFHDGLRPTMGEFIEGRITRDELARTSFSLNQMMGVWMIPFTLGTGIILSHPLLFSLDLIGVRVSRGWVAGLLGALAGAVIFLLVLVLRSALSALPVNLIEPLSTMLMPLVYAVTIIPAVAVAYQFGIGPGSLAIAVTLIAHLLNAATPAISPNVLPIAAGILVLFAFAFRAERRRVKDETIINGIESKAARFRQNVVWLAGFGALLALATRTLLFGWFALDMSAASRGLLPEAALVALTISLGFLPAVATSSVMTGVSQMIGLTFVFPVAYFAPSPLFAAVAGALVIALEVALLDRIHIALDSAPTFREVGDSLRGAMEQVTAIALIAGAFVSAERLLPGGAGTLTVAGIIAVNELTGVRIIRMAEGPVAVLALGILANVLFIAGVHFR